MRLDIVFVLTALGVAIYLADAEALTVDTNVAINIQNPSRAKAKPMTQRAAARVKPDQKGDKAGYQAAEVPVGTGGEAGESPNEPGAPFEGEEPAQNGDTSMDQGKWTRGTGSRIIGG